MVELAKIKKMQEIIEKNKYTFNEQQMNEIHVGMKNDVDFFAYLNPEYSAEQMKLIRIGLENKLDVTKYTNPKLSVKEMNDIYDELYSLKNNINQKPAVEEKKEVIVEKIEEKATHEHQYRRTITKQATCTSTGIVKLVCRECGQEVIEELPMSKHNYTTTKILPTCRSKGYVTHRCIICGHTFDDNFSESTQHTYSSEIISEPTCRRPGEILYTCINCNETYKKEIPTIDHKYESKVIAPTCIEEGYTLYTCIMCGNSYRDDISEKIEHAYTNWETIKTPTCTEKGIMEQTCLRCKTKNKKFIDPIGHKYQKKIIKPTCTEKGEIKYICSECNNQYVDEYIDMIPHTLTEWQVIRKPTLKEEGTKKCKCTMCNKEFSESIPCKELTIKNAQDEKLQEIYKNKNSNKMKYGAQKIQLTFEPILATYDEKEFNKYVKKSKFKFDPKQTLIIKEGLIEGLDVKIYANPKYDYDTMYELKKGIEHGLNLTKYAKQYDPLQINEIRLGIEHGVDIKKYLNKNFTNSQMREIRLGLEEGLNVNKIASLDGCPNFLKSTPIGNIFQPKYSASDMYEKRKQSTKKNT